MLLDIGVWFIRSEDDVTRGVRFRFEQKVGSTSDMRLNTAGDEKDQWD